MATISGTDPLAAARLAYDHIRCLGDPAFDDLPIDDKVDLMDLGITDPDISQEANRHLVIDDIIDIDLD